MATTISDENGVPNDVVTPTKNLVLRPSDYIQQNAKLNAQRPFIPYTDKPIIPLIIDLVRDTENALKGCTVPMDRPLFQPYPSRIVLQGFEPFKSYELVIHFKNMDKVTRKFRVEPIDSLHFSIHGWQNDSLNCPRVAPGMEVPFVLRFVPEEKVDYLCDIICVTERERFVLPVKAVGARALIDIPDNVVFEDCPVRHDSSKILFVRNIGDSPANFTVETSEPFRAIPEKGYLEVNGNMQLEVLFNPKTTGTFQGTMIIHHYTGESIGINMTGSADNFNIRLEKQSIRLDKTSISLSSHKTVRIYNRSNLLSKFAWKDFPNEGEEEHRRSQELSILDHEEEQELLASQSNKVAHGLNDLSLVKEGYNNKRRLTRENLYLFNDDSIYIEPVCGTIWPNSFAEFKIIFSPNKAGEVSRTAFCEIEGREGRLPLHLKGEAMGPLARFSFDVLDLSTIFINSTHQYEVILENKGDIPASFQAKDHSSLFSSRFSFKPRRGILAVGEQKIVEITFRSDILGVIEEEFEWDLIGAPSPLRLGFRGSVVGPTFQFDRNSLDFGTIAYGFPTKQTVTLMNTSQIPMNYRLRILGEDENDVTYENISISPSSGVILPHCQADIDVEFVPLGAKVYSGSIIVDIEGVGSDLLRLPLHAESIVPNIQPKQQVVNFGECFTNYTYSGKVVLVNSTPFCARYKLLEQEENAKTVYSYFSTSPSGIIQANSEVQIELDVQVKRLGQVSFPLFFQIKGNEKAPIAIDIDLTGKGPDVIISTQNLSFGKIPVLKNNSLTLTLTNESPIAADFTASMVSELSVFRVEPVRGCIEPGGVSTLKVTAFLDDTIKFTDIIKITIPSDGVHDVQVVAVGQGTTIIFDEKLNHVDFQDVFSNCECSAQFIVLNKGRRTQSLHFTREEMHTPTRELSVKDNSQSSSSFEVIPPRFTLKPGAEQLIIIKGSSNKAVSVKERLVCQAMIDKDPSRRVILESFVTAKFIIPLVQLTPSLVKFEATQLTDSRFDIMEQPLTLKNTTSLPLTLTFKCPLPFKLKHDTVPSKLASGESATVHIVYDPSSNVNRISAQEQGKLTISYREHPQKDIVELYSHVSFPNLSFSANTIRFGCILRDVEQRKTFQIQNSGFLPVNYQWFFVGDDGFDSSIAQVFDIQPNRGYLEPGETQDVDVIFYGEAGRRFDVKALCDVLGGPKYELSLQGEASVIEYGIDKRHFDFGTQPYQTISEQEVTLTNTGLVSFDFSVLVAPNSHLTQKLLVTPGLGTISPKGKQKILVRFCPCVPEVTNETFYIQIAHFEPVEMRVTGAGVFPRISLDIQRLPDPVYDSILSELTKQGFELDVSRANNANHAFYEADRRTLTTKTMEHITKLNNDYRQKVGGHENVHRGKYAGSILLFSKTVHSKSFAGKERRTGVMHEASTVKLGKFVCHFGTVVKNSSNRKCIKLTNASADPVTLSFDRVILAGTGFNIEPDKVKSLPSGESVDIYIGFSARHNTESNHVELPLSINGGPQYIIDLNAVVTVPEITIIPSVIDFGEVLCGMRKSMFIQLQNMKNVICEWTFHPQEESYSQKKGGKKRVGLVGVKEFEALPMSGSIHPNEKVVIQIRFLPLDEKEFDFSFPVRVLMNPVQQNIQLKAKGIRPAIGFDQQSLSLGPVLPYSESNEARFTIQNVIQYPIEVYSVDFDHQYQEEEEILRHYDGFEDGVTFILPRQLGATLPDSIVGQSLLKLRSENKDGDDPKTFSNLTDGTATSGEMHGVLESLTPKAQRALSATAVGLAAAYTNSTSHILNESVIADPAPSVILHGPPFSGRSTHAKRLAQDYKKIIISIDELVESGINGLEAHSTSESQRPITSLSTDEHNTSPIPDSLDAMEKPKMTEETFFEQLKIRLCAKVELGKGYVFNGIESKYSQNQSAIVKTIVKVFADKSKRITLLVLTMDLNRIRDREIIAQKLVFDRELAAIHIRELSEEEYDALKPSDREFYDAAIAKYKKQLKSIEDRRTRNDRRAHEETIRSGDRKGDDDKSKVKTTKKPPANMGNTGARPAGDKSEKGNAGSSGNKPINPNNIGEIAKSTRKAGIPSSPKGQRKTYGDKSDRDRVEAERRGGEKAERVTEGEDSRFILADESYLHESTYKRVEAYLNNIDHIFSLVKDTEKTNEKQGTRAAAATPSFDRKQARPPKSAATADILNIGPTPIPLEGEAPGGSDESSNLTVFEIGTTHLDRDGVYRSILEHLPHAAQSNDAKDDKDQRQDPILEQVVYKPGEKCSVSITSRIFSIAAITPIDDDAAPVSVEVTGPTVPASGIVQKTETSAAPMKGNTNELIKADNSKKNKATAPIKQAEDVKPITDIGGTEEESDRDSTQKYRWILQPGEKKELVVRFNPTEVGRFEQMLSFEIVGYKGRFSLPVTGNCQYANIVTDIKKVFTKWRKTKEEKSVISGEYVSSLNAFDFGPLLSSKPKEKYLEKFPENKATFKINNPSLQEIRVSFSLKNDAKGDVFFFDPQNMDLAPGQSQNVTLWAYPRTNNAFEDLFVVSIRDNPEPWCFKISCIGVKPEVEVDKKMLAFDKILLGRTEKRELRVKNPTYMPVAWRIVGVDALGEEFKVSPTEGIAESFQEVVITAEFHGLKPVTVKRVIKIEVFDIEKIGGTVQDIPILVTGEAYDIAMDLHFPKGAEGGLDFGVLKVYEENKQLVTVRNKGKYEVGFKFMFDDEEMDRFFSLAPPQGVIQPSDKPFYVQILFKSDNEVSIKDNTSLKCIVFEPTTGEVTANIPVKVSARAVFSKFSVLPVRDLNFGALIYGSKLSRQFIIENHGEYDFKYSIYKLLAKAVEAKPLKPRTPIKGNGRNSGRQQSPPPQARTVTNKKELIKQTDTLNFGAYTVSPTSGVVPAGTKQPISVEFHAETPGCYEEIIGLDISDRSPIDHPDIMEYRLIGESCIPGINTTDFSSIFEEQSVCRRLELFNTQSNVYAEEDRVFYFGAYLAGQEVQVLFKLSNPFKVPCDLSISAKPRGKSKSDSLDFAFDVEPKKLTIPSHEYRFITVTFHPTSIQSYAGLFEAVVDNVSESKFKTLAFELRGEGTLPRVTIDKPLTRSKIGLPLLKFKRLLVGASQTLYLVLKNDGIIPAKFKLEWIFKDNEDFECKEVNNYVTLKPGEGRNIEFKCKASSVRKLEGELRLKVLDNTFEDQTIQVSGEGYIDDVTFEGLSDEAENEIVMTDCAIGESKQHSFRIKNHSSDWLRVLLPESQDFGFSPTACHIRPRSEKDVTIVFSPKQPIDFQHLPLAMKMTKIRFQQNPEVEWDDRMKTIRWVGTENGRGLSKKVVELYPEPSFESASQTSDYALSVTALADYCSYECETTSVMFKSTLMFQSRVYRFSIRNTGKVVLRYQFQTLYDDKYPVEEGEECPFIISPASGTISSGEVCMFTLRFSPMDVGEYRYLFSCNIPNMASSQKPLVVSVNGSSLRPFCHFELDDSDYITSERRNPDKGVEDGIPAVLEPSTKVIEFTSCGIKNKNVKRFYIVNPTHLSYEFEWNILSHADTKIFKCITPKGMVSPGKKSEILFEFVPESIDVKESLWSFSIPDHNINIPFLLVGQANEPNVYMDHTGVNFKSVLVGRQVKETVRLVNDEDTAFAFNFNETSFEVGANGAPVLQYLPTSGTIAPRSSTPIEIIFSPASEKMFNFNIVCNVRKKPTPVTVNVKGEGYEIHESLHAEMNDGSVFELAAGVNSENNLDFGQVQVNEKRVKRITIVNSGKFNFDFSWKMSHKNSSIVAVTPEIGTVPRGERIFCEIAFKPIAPCPPKSFKLSCSVINGRTYPLTISGQGCKPLLKFSTTSIDFGTQFVYKSGMHPACHSLEIVNADVKEISLDLVSTEVPWLEISKGLTTLAPGEKTYYTISFLPREAIAYSGTLTFEINGLSPIDVVILGEGSDFRVEADQRNLNFGALRVGSSVSKTLRLTNRSKLPVTFSLGTANAMDVLASYGFHFSQSDNITLRSRGTASIEIRFIPHHRIAPFSEEIFAEGVGIIKPLCLFSGACQGTEVRLENDTLPFGAVVQRSSTTRRIQLQNTGDIGAKFYWDILQFKPDFSISPAEGYISPGMEVPMEITFHPVDLNQDIRYENIPCQVEGMQNLYLTLTGMCVSQPSQTDVIKFAASVRSPDTKSITLSNKTSNPWHIRPVIENDAWSGPEIIDIESGQTKSYDVTFLPLETTGLGEGGRHEGSIFFPLPDGTGILYRLSGVADKPLSAGNISREIPCKTQFTEILSVSNWLKRPQRFKVSIESARPDASVVIKAHDFVDVPPLISKDFKVGFYAYKEGMTNLKVIFRNEMTQEYLHYNLTYKSTAPGIIATYDLATIVRQGITKEITLYNPLTVPATFTCTSNNPDLSVPHQFAIQPKSEGNIALEFLPLQPKDSIARVTLTSSDLGLYQYDVKLFASPAGPERSLHFKVGLGGSQTQTFRFINYVKSKTDYMCKIESPDFFVEKSVNAPAASSGGAEVSVDITYEPSRLGDTRTQLIVSSASGGDYVCPLNGHCVAPRPQGPIFIRQGTSSTLPFKNVFSASATFNLVVDNPAFIVKATETIAPKKTVQISIGYKPPALTNTTTAGPSVGGNTAAGNNNTAGVNANDKNAAANQAAAARAQASKVGKLTITHANSNMSWVYYLRYTSN